MPRGFVDDVRGGCVDEVGAAADVGGDRQDRQRLELLEGARWDESVDAHGAPAEASEPVVHLAYRRNPLDRDAGRRQPFAVGGVRRLHEARVHLQQDEAPHRLVRRRILVIVLLDDETAKMRGDLRCRVRHP